MSFSEGGVTPDFFLRSGLPDRELRRWRRAANGDLDETVRRIEGFLEKWTADYDGIPLTDRYRQELLAYAKRRLGEISRQVAGGCAQNTTTSEGTKPAGRRFAWSCDKTTGDETSTVTNDKGE